MLIFFSSNYFPYSFQHYSLSLFTGKSNSLVTFRALLAFSCFDLQLIATFKLPSVGTFMSGAIRGFGNALDS